MPLSGIVLRLFHLGEIFSTVQVFDWKHFPSINNQFLLQAYL